VPMDKVSYFIGTNMGSQLKGQGIDVDIEALVAGNTPTNVHSSGTWTAGVNHRNYPRARGLFMILLLSSSGTWGWEGAVCFMEPSGKWR
jgi:hypothetical protein